MLPRYLLRPLAGAGLAVALVLGLGVQARLPRRR